MRMASPHLGAVLEALKFRNPQREALRSLSHSDWEELLPLCDMFRLTLPLRQVCAAYIPRWVRSRVDRNISDHEQRMGHLQAVYTEAAQALGDAGAEHLVLKGFAQWPAGMWDARFRFQSDIDLFCPPESIVRAPGALTQLGYELIQGAEHQPTDHLPTMMRRTEWKWRGDYFDPDIPIPIELHFRFWNDATTRLRPEGMDQFWLRRVERQWDDLSFPALHPVDSLGYAALHVLHHLLFGGLSPYHTYELAWFLHMNAENTQFWEQWQELHADSLRRLEAVSFRLAADRFDCALPEEVEKEIYSLPDAALKWFDRYQDALQSSFVSPSKTSLWLHLSLLNSARDKAAVSCSTLVPVRVPPASAVSHWFPRTFPKFVLHAVSRIAYHLRVLPATLWEGACWWWSQKELNREFKTFLAASWLFDIGMSIFFLLYNLYLLDRGFNEQFLGMVASAMALGAIAGTIPGGAMVQRLGVRKTQIVCFALVAVISALRAVVGGELPLLALSLLVGASLSIWAVAIAPTVAQLTHQKNRPFAFSLVFSSGIGMGIVAGQLGGHLPGWMARVSPQTSTAGAKQAALLMACGIVLLGLWPISRLRLEARPMAERKLYPRNPFLWRFLPAMAAWSLVTGAFSPFFNAYFSQYLHMPVERIGATFSFSQLAQVAAVLAAPAVFRKFGLVTGIVYMQLATAVMLGSLALGSASSAAILFASYMALQYMSEPGMYSLLMNQVKPEEQGGASALNFLVINSAQALSAAVAGAALVRYGYPAVVGMTAAAAVGAAMAFRMLLGPHVVPMAVLASASDAGSAP